MDKNAIYKLTYGLFVLTAKQDEQDNGCIINTAIQVTDSPNRISITVNKANFTHDMIKETGDFTISSIGEDADFELFKRFGFQSGRDVNKFVDFDDFSYSKNGTAYITKGTNAYISARVEQIIDLDTHTMFIAEVTDMQVLSDIPSATYAYYHKNIKPQPQEVATTPEGKTIWRCIICGYEYEGEELPEDFICPLCKHSASDFEKVQ